MTEPFPLHDETTSPEASREALATTKRNFGMIPNLERVMATAPALLAAYSSAWNGFDTTSLSRIEQQVVYQTANFENDCTYCVPWHSYLAKQAQIKPGDVEALRTGAELSEPKLQALRVFTRQLIHNRGKIAHADLDAFFAAGYEPQQALEVVLGIAIKVMSNYTNAIAGTPLDREVAKLAWRKPIVTTRSGDTPASDHTV
ncbi:MAG: carboxymuconolactone decarboxylase family protein [Geminicoccaceae bacterium]